MSSFAAYPLEGDGISPSLFYYLWRKDEMDWGPHINIPDTIVFKHRLPMFWYFTSSSGTIKKKSKFKLSNVRIEEAFTRKTMGSDIIAYYISGSEEKGVFKSSNSRIISLIFVTFCVPSGLDMSTIEYFNRDNFRDFLYKREKMDGGILQRFVEPKGTHNCNSILVFFTSPFLTSVVIFFPPKP